MALLTLVEFQLCLLLTLMDLFLASQFSSEGRWIIVLVQHKGSFFILANVYGSNRSSQNKIILQDLNNRISLLKRQYISAFVIVGDFNEVPNPISDRYPSRGTGNMSNPVLGYFCKNLSLLDAYRHLNPSSLTFTWFKADMSQKSPIDLWLISDNLLNALLCSLN